MYYPLWWDFSIHCHEKCSLLEKIINIYINKTNLPCLFFFFFFWSNQLEKVWTSQRAALIPSLLKERPSSSFTEYSLCYTEKPRWCVCAVFNVCVYFFSLCVCFNRVSLLSAQGCSLCERYIIRLYHCPSLCTAREDSLRVVWPLLGTTLPRWEQSCSLILYVLTWLINWNSTVCYQSKKCLHNVWIWEQFLLLELFPTPVSQPLGSWRLFSQGRWHKNIHTRASSHAISTDTHSCLCVALQRERHSSLYQNNDNPLPVMVFVCTPMLIPGTQMNRPKSTLSNTHAECMHVLTSAIRWPHCSTKSNYTPSSPSAEFSCSECGLWGEPGVIQQLEHTTEMGWDGWKTGEEKG